MSLPSTLALSFLKDPNAALPIFLAGLTLMVLFFWYFATEFETRKRNIGSVLIVSLCLFCGLALYPPKESLKGGIDLVGGSSFTLLVKPKIDETTGQPLPLTTEDVKQARKTIEERLNKQGTTDMLIVEQGTDKLLIQMPGMTPEVAAEIKVQLQKVARLELRKVNMDGFAPGADGRTLAERIKDKDEPRIPGYEVFEYEYTSDGTKRTEFLLLSRRIALTGKDVQQAWPESMAGSHHVSITLTSAGAEKMLDLTGGMNLQRDRLAVVLDGKVITAPVVNAALHKNFIIEGQESSKEARDLASTMLNPLENPLEIIEERTVSPTLGKAVVTQGLYAGIVGLSITALFVLIYYRTAGIIALVGLAVNTIMIFGGMAMFGFTFTLPGIAGMILSIGMAVDANVLIYERLREEIAAGKSLSAAIAAAYEKAFTAIFDSNLTSLITAIILFWMGSGTIKGFAITLTIGIVASMFSAILVTRVLFRWGNDLHLLRKLSFLDLIKATRIDFLSKGKVSYIVSGVLILASIGAFATRGEKSFGIDFTGGTLIQFQLGKDDKIAQPDVEKAFESLQVTKAPTVQEETSITGELLTVRCATVDAEKVVTHLRESFPLLAELVPGTDKEGKPNGTSVFKVQQSTEAVAATLGKDFLIQSLIALALGLLGILIYITLRFEFSFALGGFVALLHDVVLSTGLIVLFGGELSLIHVGALLTIAGYSINDTIVIFDRIRESLKQGEGDIKDLMNEAINATLSRTILTSLTTIATVTILTIFGGAALKDFSAMILIGLVIGTYSSVFIASPVVLWWSQRKGGSLRKEILQTTLAEADIQA